MPVYVALLRAVNLGPHNRISMADLRAAIESTGASDVRTLLASGNAVFASKARSAAAVETAIADVLKKKHGLETGVFVRDAAAWKKAIDGNPFPAEAKRDPGHLVIMALAGKPAAAALAALEGAIVGRERVALRGSELYLCYPDGIGESKLTYAIIERKLGVAGTGRNWNTALKILALMDGGA